ncbi:hypothetical protein L6452_38939 [Arctium lappa]|uniref:Uncharacterized protein n=1 Tax=Arctium lappa TaxID=4217 RepID=A0ACB8XR54_ARCLA|nr:hypothetical protein L6452_38939 [Arctium lappa]
MILFLEGVYPTIPEYVANGPYVPFIIITAVPATSSTEAVPEREVVKEIRQWSDEDKKKVGLDDKSKTIISMALLVEVFHSIMHLKTTKAMWDTIYVQYEGTIEQSSQLKKNLVKDSKDSKTTPVALVSSEMIPSQRSSTLTITYSKLTDKGKYVSHHPQKATKVAKLKKVPSKPSSSKPSGSGSKITSNTQRSTPKLKIDILPKKSEKLKATFSYRKCYQCGLTDYISSKCLTATIAKKSTRVKMNTSKAKKVTKVEKPAKVKNTTKVKKLTKGKIATDVESSDDSKGIWYLDRGCSRHITGQRNLLADYKEEKGPSETFGGNGKGYTRGFGVLSNSTTTFRRVSYIDGLKHNLLNINVNWLWHKRLSHLNSKMLNNISSKEPVFGLPKHSYDKESLCSTCERGKQTKASFKSKQVSSVTSPLQLLHMD